MDYYTIDADGTTHKADSFEAFLAWGQTQVGDWRRVALTEVGDVKVSTVFLGVDHNHFGGPPILFETMVFGGPLDQEEERYTTRAEAVNGHLAMCAKVWPT